MKALLICPDKGNASTWPDSYPLAATSILSKPLIFYWIEYFVERGVKELIALCSDRPDVMRGIVGDGSRWGIKLDVVPERSQLTIDEARHKYFAASNGSSAVLANIAVVDRLPSSTAKIFENGEIFFNTIRCVLPDAGVNRVAMRQLSPGVWVSTNAQIPASAVLLSPCWIGHHARVGEGATIGPTAVIENNVIVGRGAILRDALIQSHSYVGEFTEVRNSIVSGNLLFNWKTNSQVVIKDPFLLGSVIAARSKPRRASNLFGRAAALVTAIMTAPLAATYIAICRLKGIRAIEPKVAGVKCGEEVCRIKYYEFQAAAGYAGRWPQLFNIIRGEFAWFGNRPLDPREIAKLKTDFEKLWLESPIGMFSQADAAGCWKHNSDEAKAHASFYAIRHGTPLNWTIFKAVLKNWRLAQQHLSARKESRTGRDRIFDLGRVVSDFLSL